MIRHRLTRSLYLSLALSVALAALFPGRRGAEAFPAHTWPATGSDTVRVHGVSVGTVDWVRGDAVARGTAYASPGARLDSDSYWRAAYRSRRDALNNLQLVVEEVARGRHLVPDSNAVSRAARRAIVVDRRFQPGIGKLTLTVAVALFGTYGALGSDQPGSRRADPFEAAQAYDRQRSAGVSQADVDAALPTVESGADLAAQIDVPIEVYGPDRDGSPVDVSDPPVEVNGPAPVTSPVILPPVARAGPPSSSSASVSVGLDHTPGGQEGPFTGVVIDCRGLGLMATMSPRIRTADGREVWGSAKVDHKFAEEVGIAGFMEDWHRAVGYEPRVGQHPLILRAIAVTGGRSRSQAVIADDDAAWLLREDASSHFLDKFHVMFVVDPLRL